MHRITPDTSACDSSVRSLPSHCLSQLEEQASAVRLLCSLVRRVPLDCVVFLPLIQSLAHHHSTRTAYDALVDQLLRPSTTLHPSGGEGEVFETWEEGEEGEVGQLAEGEGSGGRAAGEKGGKAGGERSGRGEELGNEGQGGRPHGLIVNRSSLSAWEATQRSTREDWHEWIRRLSVELLRESASPALRACAPLAQVRPHFHFSLRRKRSHR